MAEIQTYSNRCTKGITQSNLQGIFRDTVKHYREICRSRAGREAMFDALQCAHPPAPKSAFEEVHKCSDTLAVIFETIESMPSADQITGFCCASNYAFKCMKDNGRSSCSSYVPDPDETVNWYHDHLDACVGNSYRFGCGDKFTTIEGCNQHAPHIAAQITKRWAEIYTTPALRSDANERSIFLSMVNVFNTIPSVPDLIRDSIINTLFGSRRTTAKPQA